MEGSSITAPSSLTANERGPQQLVDDLGAVRGEQLKASIEVAMSLPRFPFTLTGKEEEYQQEKRLKILQQINLPKFDPRDEEDFENWVDDVAATVTRLRVSVAIFHEAWISVAAPYCAAKIRMIGPAASHEEIVNQVAQAMNWRGSYIDKIERQIYQLDRKRSVREARISVELKIARLYRLCQRWQVPFTVSDRRLRQIALDSLPLIIEEDYHRTGQQLSWHLMWERAEMQEDWMIRRLGRLPEPLHSYPAYPGIEQRPTDTEDDAQMASGKEKKRKKREDNETVRKNCKACGQTNHYTKECRYLNARCFKCQVIGHISRVCPNLAIKDQRGRVETIVTPKPSKIVTEQRRDKTKLDKLTSAQSTIDNIAKEQIIAKDTAAARRRKKSDGSHRVRRRIEHEELVAEESVDEVIEDGQTSSEDEVVATDQSKVLTYFGAAAVEGSPVLKVKVVINGFPTIAILDTGASRSICNAAQAKELQLTEGRGKTRYFVGLGDLQGKASNKCQLQLGPKRINARFYIVNKENLPVLIGLAELTKLKVILDIPKRRIIDSESLRQIEAFPAAESTEHVPMDPITQKKLGLSDEALIKEGKELIMEKTSHLTPETAKRVWQLFEQFAEVWMRPKPAGAAKYTAKFEVVGPPVKMKMRPLAKELTAELITQIDAMLAAGVISPSKSPWGSVPVFVKKKDGGWRLCLDYRRINQQMRPDRYPLPLLWPQIQRAAGHQFYTTIDLNWGFWSLPLHHESRQYTALITPKGLFEFNILPMGIRNSPSEFQRMMDQIFSEVAAEQISWYMDDIIIYSNDIEEMLDLMRKVMVIMKENGLYIKLSKLEIIMNRALVLGHILSKKGLMPNPRKIQGLRSAQVPENLKELRRFLGSVNFLRRFIPNCADMEEPLLELTRKGTTFEMSARRIAAFNNLKMVLEEQALLAAPDGSDDLVIICDASDVGIGAVLLQKQGEELMPLEYASKSLTKSERNWPTYEREAFAIRWAVERFEDYIKIKGATVFTDHQSLQWLLNAKTGRVRRWSLYIQQFQLCIRHISGKQNVLADWLSRSVPDEDPFGDEKEIAIPDFGGTAEESAESVESSLMKDESVVPYLPSYMEIKKATKREEDANIELEQTYVGSDGIRYNVKSNKMYIPTELRVAFIYWLHASKYGGHAGINRTVKRLGRWVWWPSMKKSVTEFIEGCLTCKRNRVVERPVSLKGILSKPEPLEMISIDCVGPRMWWNTKRYYICIIDHASRFVNLSSRDHAPTSKDIIDMLKERWLPIFQMPYSILTDRGTEFVSKEFVDFVNGEMGCALVRTSPYYPQGNSVNEVAHRTIKNMITAASSDWELSFEETLQIAAVIHNSSPHMATGCSPYYYLFGMEATLPGWQGLQHQDKCLSSRHLKRREERLKAIYRESLMQEQQVTLQVTENIKEGDWIVYLLSGYEQKALEGSESKYSPSWSLPAKVIKLKDRVCVVKTWQQRERQVPFTQVRVLRGTVHPMLAELNLNQLRYQLPFRRTAVEHQQSVKSWKEFLGDAEDEIIVKDKGNTDSGAGAKKRVRFTEDRSCP